MAKKKQVTATIKDENEVSKLIKIILILIALFGIFYVATYFITKNKKNETNYDTSLKVAAIQYDKILISNILSQKNDEYYVLLGKADNQYYKIYESYINTYAAKDGALKFYTVDMNDIFNRENISDTSNFNVENMSSIKVKEITIIKVIKGSISDIYEGNEAVNNLLKDLVK